MKCSACGEENAQNARFCSSCGARLSAASPDEERKETRDGEEAVEKAAEAHTAQPLSDNPYQPRRMPTIYADGSPQAARELLPATRKAPRVFLFDDEKEEEEKRLRELERDRQAARRQAELERRAEEDPFFDEDDEDEDNDYDDDEESTGRGGKIFIAVISIITILILAVGALAFLYYTPTGSRLRASQDRI